MLMSRPVLVGMLLGMSVSTFGDHISPTFDEMDASHHLAIAFDGLLASDRNTSIRLTSPDFDVLNDSRSERDFSRALPHQFNKSNRPGDRLGFKLLNDISALAIDGEYAIFPEVEMTLLEEAYCRCINLCTGELSLNIPLSDLIHSTEVNGNPIDLTIWKLAQQAGSDSPLALPGSSISSQPGVFDTHSTAYVSENSSELPTDFLLASLGTGDWDSTQDSLGKVSAPGSLRQLVVVPLPVPAILAGTGLAILVITRRMRRPRI